MNCPKCEEEMYYTKIPFLYNSRYLLGEFEAVVCKSCGAKYFTEKGFSNIRKTSIEMEIWGNEPFYEPIEEDTSEYGDDIGTFNSYVIYPPSDKDSIFRNMITASS